MTANRPPQPIPVKTYRTHRYTTGRYGSVYKRRINNYPEMTRGMKAWANDYEKARSHYDTFGHTPLWYIASWEDPNSSCRIKALQAWENRVKAHANGGVDSEYLTEGILAFVKATVGIITLIVSPFLGLIALIGLAIGNGFFLGVLLALWLVCFCIQIM